MKKIFHYIMCYFVLLFILTLLSSIFLVWLTAKELTFEMIINALPFTLPPVIIYCLIIDPAKNLIRKYRKQPEEIIDKNSGMNLNVTMLGASNSGKTTLLACILRELMLMSKKISGFRAGFQVTDCERLEELYNMLIKMNTSPTHKITGESISLRYRKAALNVSFYDFPGEYLDSDSDSESVSSLMKDSSVIIIPINMPFLVEENGKYKAALKISELEYLLRNDLLENNSGKLIILAPVMCEKYTKTITDSQIMREKITSAYKGVIKDVELYASKLAGKFAVVMVPVNTLSNAVFERFSFESGNETPECVYSRDSNLQPESQNADQLTKLALIFMLREILRQDGLITDSDSRSDINKLIDQIKDAAKFHNSQNDTLFTEIIYGREILTGA